MRVRVEIRADSLEKISRDLSNNFEARSSFSEEKHIRCKRLPQPSRSALPAGEALAFVFEFGGAVSAGIIANWLYSKLRGSGAIVVIGDEEIRIENAEKLREIIILTATYAQSSDDRKP
jgi:hypothetical protein